MAWRIRIGSLNHSKVTAVFAGRNAEGVAPALTWAKHVGEYHARRDDAFSWLARRGLDAQRAVRKRGEAKRKLRLDGQRAAAFTYLEVRNDVAHKDRLPQPLESNGRVDVPRGR